MWKNQMSTKQAFEFVKSKRACIRPNEGFLNQLDEFEKELRDEEEELTAELKKMKDSYTIQISKLNEEKT